MSNATNQMTSRERIVASLNHQQPDRIPIDFGGMNVTGIHASCVAGLREYYGLEKRPIRIQELFQMLGIIDDDLKDAMGLDVVGVYSRKNKVGLTQGKLKVWKINGMEVLVPEEFQTTIDVNGDVLAYPQGDLSVPPSGRMPSGGYFFDCITRQDPIDDDHLNPEDNLEEFGLITQEDLNYLQQATAAAAATGRAVSASFGGTAFGDVGVVPAPGLKHPKGIRDVTEWYVSTSSRQDYIHQVFEAQCEIALKNFEKIYAAVGNNIQIAYICGTDFGTQTSAFCSVNTFRSLYFPYYKRINDWIHAHTPWKTFKHSCGAVSKFLPSMIECGFDIINPVQCSATGMDPHELKAKFGQQLVFWGGGVDTQQTLPFGNPAEVREQVLHRCEVFGPGGGFVFNSIHNVQAQTPIKNIVAMVDAVHEFNGR